MASCKGMATGDVAAAAACSVRKVSVVQKHAEPPNFDANTTVPSNQVLEDDIEVDLRELYFLIMHFLSSGPCHRATGQLWNELLQHKLLPRRYHAWHSRTGSPSKDEDDDGSSFPLSYVQVMERHPNIEKNHLVKLLRQQLVASRRAVAALELPNSRIPTAGDIPTLLGVNQFSLLDEERMKGKEQNFRWMQQLRWPHWQSKQVHGVALRELGGGFARHHRPPSIRAASYAIAKPSVLVDRIQIIKKFRGHRNAVYCAIFDRSGQHIITGSDDRLVKIWSTETGFCLRSCRGHEGDITDLAVNSGNALVASASNDCTIRVWRLQNGFPVSVLRGHTGGVTAIAFSPRQGCEHHLLSSSDDGTCRIWDARDSTVNSRLYMPKPDPSNTSTKLNVPAQPAVQAGNQILCCAFNADGSIFATGSSDRLARVWDARKWNDEITGKPNHELDVLKGHENDVNYVQFSGCAGVLKPFLRDLVKEERLQKFKNSWFPHDNIVTCSRDGSAIIWTPRSRKYHARSCRWMKAYHLRVPPPPMPPQPPRGGGPRQRLLPTPRGVNMIVWSLDNRFVLAAIMDCRICVWNAVDGSLVHSLTGHDKSTYVLDVHPFNPRIAMSAGYDGRVIIWDIWEGRPVRVYETGDFDLVDGNFSPDGTSIVVSDEVGQILLLATGQGESQKDAKYDQFFLGDFRPLVRDASGNVLDQETRMEPHQRNIQDLLCDANMIPYPEPYQSMYQQRRLGALGIDWQPPCVNLAVGTMDDATFIGFGDNPFALNPALGGSPGDMDRHALDGAMRWVEQPTYADDAMDWEQEAARLSDDSGSDYNASEESLSDVDDEASANSTEGSTNSEDEEEEEEEEEESEHESIQETHLRRSNRNKRKAEVMAVTSSGKRVRKQQVDSQETCEANPGVLDETLARNGQAKDSPSPPPAVRTVQLQSTRPKRRAAKNALRLFSNISTHEEEDDVQASSAHDRCSDSSERIPEAEKSLQGNMQEDGPGEEEVLEKDLSSKLETSEVGEFSKRPRSHRRLVLKLRNTEARTVESNSNGSREDPTDALPVQEQPALGTEVSKVMAPDSQLEDMNQRTSKRLVIRPPRPAPPLPEVFGGFSDTGDNVEDSSDVANRIAVLKTSPSDEVQSSEACRSSPAEEKRKWEWKEMNAAKRARNGNGDGTVEPLDIILDGLSCSSDRSASNSEECLDASGNSLWANFHDTVLRSNSHDGNKNSGGLARGLRLGSSKVHAKRENPPHLEEREHSGKPLLEPMADLQSPHSCVARLKSTELRGLEVPLYGVDEGAHTERKILTRSGASARRYVMERHKDSLSSQNVEPKPVYVSQRFRTAVEKRHKQVAKGDMIRQMNEIHNCNRAGIMINGSSHVVRETKGNSIYDRNILLHKSSEKLKEHCEPGFSQPDDQRAENSHVPRKKPSRETSVRTRGALKQSAVSKVPQEACDMLEREILDGIAQTALKEEGGIMQSVSQQNSHSDYFQENDAWSVSESEKESAREDRQMLKHKRRTLGELHAHAMLGSASNLLQNSSEDLMCKRRIRHMRSVMSENGREATSKRSREKRVPVSKGREIPGRSSRRKRTRMEHIPWHENSEDGERRQSRHKAEVDNGHIENYEGESSSESNRMRAVDLRGFDENVMPTLNKKKGTRVSTRVRRDISRRDMPWDRDPGRLSEVNVASRDKCVRTKKNSAWLMLSEVEEGTRYIPQYGDEVVYLRQGHQEYLESQQTDEMGPWTIYMSSIRAVEFCRVTELDYAVLCDSGDTFCKLTLEFTDQTSKVLGKSFKLNLPELTNFPDFLVEKSRYEAAIQRNWTSRDKCQVWWRSEDGKGGNWWDGRVISVKPKSPEFPDSPWERFVVQYRVDTSKPLTHSPWELFDSKNSNWEPSRIDQDMRAHLSSILEECADEPEDTFGLRRFKLLSNRADFINRLPLPLTMEIIKLRLEKNYYRTVDAFYFDLHLIVSNVRRYFGVDSEIAHKLQRLDERLTGDSFLLDYPSSS